MLKKSSSKRVAEKSAGRYKLMCVALLSLFLPDVADQALSVVARLGG